MWSAIGSWFIGTRLGQATILAAAITASAFATYFYIDSKAYDRGYGVAKSECSNAQSNAKTGELNKRADQSQGASEIAARADENAEKASTTIDNQTNSDKDKDHEDFRAPAAPVAGCAAAVPVGVQARLDAAVERAND